MRILVTSTPGTGHLNAVLPLCSALQSAGHDVLVVTGPESCESVGRQGFDVRQGGMSSDERRAAYEPRMAETMALDPRHRRGRLFAGFFADIAAPAMRIDLLPVFDEFQPEVVIHERAELASGTIAAARRTPHVTVAFSGALPPWAEQLLTTSIVPVWAAEGLPLPTMDQINGDLYLHPFPASFGQAPAGGVVREMRAVPAVTAEARPQWLEELDDSRPLVYVTSGTEPLAAELFPWAAAFAAFATLDIDVIATIGSRFDPAVLGDVPSNVRLERFVPQHFVLERASVAVSHAGAGSVLGAAAHGLPQVLVPQRADQWENADAAASANAAIILELDRRNAADIGAAVQRAMADDRFKRAATRVAAEIAAMPSPTDHVATIEALAAQHISD